MSASVSPPVLQPSAPSVGIPIPSAGILAMVNPEGAPAYKGDTGGVEGVVVVKGPPAPDVPDQDFSKCPDAAKDYGKLFREGKELPGGGRALGDTIVAVTGYKDFYLPESRESVRVVAKGCATPRRTITLTYGQRIDFKNETATPLLAPALLQMPSPALMVAAAGGEPVKIYPQKPGRYRLIQKIDYPFMQADVFAFLHPLHAVTDTAGKFRIDGVPVGKLTVNAKHPSFRGEASKEILVKKGLVERVELVLTFSSEGARPPPDAGPPIILR